MVTDHWSGSDEHPHLPTVEQKQEPVAHLLSFRVSGAKEASLVSLSSIFPPSFLHLSSIFPLSFLYLPSIFPFLPSIFPLSSLYLSPIFLLSFPYLPSVFPLTFLCAAVVDPDT